MHRAHPDPSPWFGREAVAISPLGSPGFSGAGVFVVRPASGSRFVLKNFAAATPLAQAAWVHGLMRHLRACGLASVPNVMPLQSEGGPAHDRASATLAADQSGTLWELLEWIPGAARSAPGRAEISRALAELARLHEAAATLPGSPPRVERSPGVARRIDQAGRMRAAPWRRLDPAAAPCSADMLHGRLLEAVEIFETCGGMRALARLTEADAIPVATQPVLRDVWSDHVLFADDGSLAGFIDFHAAGRDTPATDLARLLGSWLPHDHHGPGCERWQQAIAAYEAVRPLAPEEKTLLPWLHATGVICGLDNWFRWLFLEGRTFADVRRVAERIDRLLLGLPAALETVCGAAPGRN